MKKVIKNLHNLLLQKKYERNTVVQGKKYPLSPVLEQNLIKIREAFGESSDVVVRRFYIGKNYREAALFYIDGLADKNFIAEEVIKPLTICFPADGDEILSRGRLLNFLRERVISAGEVNECQDLEQIFSLVLAGDSALFIDGESKSFTVSSKGFASRGVQEPDTEAVIRGPREGFTEVLRTNTALIRRKLNNPDLRVEQMRIGRQTKTDIAIVYINGICDEKIVREVKNRLASIDTDAILESGYIEAYIEDAPFSPFATIGNTEKPDIAAAKMLEGRLCVIVDGTPMVLTIPYLFIESFQTSEDYYSRPYYVSLVRWLRYLSFFLTIFLPAGYIALTTFHQEMIPTALVITMAAAREGTPFPAVVEAISMGIIFEILREAGVRMPRPIGQAVSIVGALVIGEAAVSAGLIGAPMVIVVALTAITSFLVPSSTDVAALLRFTFALLAGASGLYGLILGTLLVLIHLCALRSFGVPYFSPVAPTTWRNLLQDVLVRAPLWAMQERPGAIGSKNLRRHSYPLKPVAPLAEPSGKKEK